MSGIRREKLGRLICAGIATLALAGCAKEANAAIIELPLAAEGRYDFDSSYWMADFDLGIQFFEISNVYIDWAGEITAGLAIDYRNPDETFPLEVGIYASLGGSPFTRSTKVWGGETTYPAPELFDCQSEFELVGVVGGSTWSDLLDGQGTITIEYHELIMLYGRYVEHGSVTVERAVLIVDGVIPEPTTLFLLIVGVLGLRVKYSIRRCKP